MKTISCGRFQPCDSLILWFYVLSDAKDREAWNVIGFAIYLILHLSHPYQPYMNNTLK